MSPPLTRTGRPNTSGTKAGTPQSRPLPAPTTPNYDPQQEAQFRGVLQSQLDDIRRNANAFLTSLINFEGPLSVLGNPTNVSAAASAIVGAAAQVLRVNNAGNALAFGAVDLGQAAAVTGVLPIANGGAGIMGAAKSNYIWIDKNNVNQTGIAQATFTKVQWGNKNSDVDGVFDATTNFRYTPNIAGKFMIAGAFNLGSTGSNLTRGISSIFKNGAELFRTSDISIANAGGLAFMNMPFSGIVNMNGTTDYIEIFTYFQSNGGLADGQVSGNTNNTYLTAQRIGP